MPLPGLCSVHVPAQHEKGAPPKQGVPVNVSVRRRASTNVHFTRFLVFFFGTSASNFIVPSQQSVEGRSQLAPDMSWLRTLCMDGDKRPGRWVRIHGGRVGERKGVWRGGGVCVCVGGLGGGGYVGTVDAKPGRVLRILEVL